MSPLIHKRKNRLLSALSQDNFDKFFSNLTPVRLAQRHVLYEIGAPIEYVYFIEDGLSSILTTMADGACVEVGMVGREGMVSVAALLGGEVSVQHVVMQLPGSALRASASACKAAFDQSDAVREVFLRFFETTLNLSTQTAACNRLHTAEQRCARWLLMSSDRIQSDLLPLTHEYLSAMLGIRRARVSEIAGELQRSALIRYHHGQITIIDRDGLAATACECYRLDREQFDRLP
jgi:CRP-like cAMP-binding protein